MTGAERYGSKTQRAAADSTPAPTLPSLNGLAGAALQRAWKARRRALLGTSAEPCSPDDGGSNTDNYIEEEDANNKGGVSSATAGGTVATTAPTDTGDEGNGAGTVAPVRTMRAAISPQEVNVPDGSDAPAFYRRRSVTQKQANAALTSISGRRDHQQHVDDTLLPPPPPVSSDAPSAFNAHFEEDGMLVTPSKKDASMAFATTVAAEPTAVALDDTRTDHPNPPTADDRALATLLEARVEALASELARASAERIALEQDRRKLAAETMRFEAWRAAETEALSAAGAAEKARAERDARIAVRQARAEASAVAASGERSLRVELDEARTTVVRLRAELFAAEARNRELLDRHQAERETLRARIAELESSLLHHQQRQPQPQQRSEQKPAPPGPSAPRATAQAPPYGPLQTAPAADGTVTAEKVDAAAAALQELLSAAGVLLHGNDSADSPPSNSTGSLHVGGNHLTVASTPLAAMLSPELRNHILSCPRPASLGRGVIAEGIPRTGERDLEAGKREQRFADGTRIVTFRNGTEKEERPDGAIIVRFANGDVRRVGPGGEVETYLYADARTLHTAYRGSHEVYEFDSGQVECHWANGDREVLFADGTVVRR